MRLFSVSDSEEKRLQNITKKVDPPPPPPPPVTQQIQFGNPPPLLDLINRHSLVISFWYIRFSLSFNSYIVLLIH